MRTRAHGRRELSWGSLVAQHWVRLLLLVAAKQEWCSLVCSSGSPSYPVAWSSCWCSAWLPVRHGGFWKNCLFYVPLSALFAHGNLDIAFTLVSFSPSVFGCCLWSTLYYSDKNDYLPVFCFEGLIIEFVEITYRFPSLRASFSSQVKNV